ncbi:hypothetical protein Hypma_006138 [Hypsizygus marmoreus]|uniref:Uncharacterized protein n=1 Tax=Hypsizygus marmoreus TaxID=39966 RepID=A0A369K2Q1_HYPMA|nr:hypothetical protein Hypma_006138 [Hypsizygus marmoreus]
MFDNSAAFLLTVLTREPEQQELVLCEARHPANSTLPAEILADIFLYCLPTEVRPRLDEAPLLLCHVCSFWRQTALGTPRLWQTLFINTSRHPHIPSRILSNLLRFWSEGVAPHPLSLSFKAKNSSAFVRDALKGLTPFTRQLGNLSLSVTSLAALVPIIDLTSDCFPSLIDITLETTHEKYLQFTPRRSVFDVAPSLRNVCIRGASVLENISFPWGQLTSLVLERHLRPCVWRSVFSQCVNLESGSFVVDCIWDTRISDDTIANRNYMPHGKLEMLKFRLESDITVSLFEGFSFPALCTFCLSASIDFVIELLDTDFNLIRQLHLCHNLRCLVLANILIEAEDVLSLLASIPKLEKLGLDVEDIDYATLFDELHTAIGEGSALSCLTSFVINASTRIDEALSSLTLVITSLCGRNKERRPLEELSLFVWITETLQTYRAAAFLSDVRKDLETWTYDKDVCPNGFVLTTDIVAVDFDIVSAIHWL